MINTSSLSKPDVRDGRSTPDESCLADDDGRSRAGTGAAKCDVSLVDAKRLLPTTEAAWVREQAARAIDLMGLGGEVRVRLADDLEVEAVHLERLGVSGTTDVITFDLADPGDPSRGLFLDVDLLVCVDEARRQASARGIPVRQEVLLYVLHGVLHCMGHDDHDPEDSRTMHAREDEILEAIGVGKTFVLAEVGPSADAEGQAGRAKL